MCLAVFALDAHPDYALVLAANRDEYHARPAAPAAWGSDAPWRDILAGRDLAAGGTWLGVRRDGRFAFVTNVRDGRGQDPALRTRGELVPHVLGHADSLDDTLADIDGAAYNGFNLVAGDASRLIWMSNRGHDPSVLPHGVHGLSNAALDVPWPKLVRTQGRLREWLASGTQDTAPLLAALADRTRAADAQLPSTGVTLERERLLSPPFILSERYGTRCSTVLTLGRDGQARFHERSFAPDGTATGDVVETFALK
ncbi:MAG: NRDE family protein [Burkholderiales bacterium]|nr:NRDE family protein [Burkholderiales bacterium]